MKRMRAKKKTMRVSKLVVRENDQESDKDYERESDKTGDKRYDRGTDQRYAPSLRHQLISGNQHRSSMTVNSPEGGGKLGEGRPRQRVTSGKTSTSPKLG